MPPTFQGVSLLSSLRSLLLSSQALQRSQERLSSAMQINRASDNPAGFVQASLFDTQRAGLQQANRNIQETEALLNTAQGGQQALLDNLRQLRSLALQAGNTFLTGSQRDAILQEARSLLQSIDQIVENTTFNGKPLLQGGTIQVQTTESAGGTQQVPLPNNTLQALNLDDFPDDLPIFDPNLDLTDTEAVNSALQGTLSVLEEAIEQVEQDTIDLATTAQALESNRSANQAEAIELARATSHIRDTDFGLESIANALSAIRQQAGILTILQGLQNQRLSIGNLLNAFA